MSKSIGSLVIKVLSSVLLLSSFSFAQTDEASLIKLSQDPALKWGTCPAFIGEGCQIAVLHGDPAQTNSDIFFKVPADFKIPNHWHTSPERMILIKGQLDVTYEGEQTSYMSTGAYAYGPAKKPHTAYCHKAEECILFIAFENPIDAFEIK